MFDLVFADVSDYTDAACAKADLSEVDVFYPRSGGANAVDTAAAKEFCAACPLAAQCLKDALAEEAANTYGDRFGIRGGLTAAERAQLVNGTTGKCGTKAGRAAHRRAGTKPCAPCQKALNAYYRDYRDRKKAAAS